MNPNVILEIATIQVSAEKWQEIEKELARRLRKAVESPEGIRCDEEAGKRVEALFEESYEAVMGIPWRESILHVTLTPID